MQRQRHWTSHNPYSGAGGDSQRVQVGFTQERDAIASRMSSTFTRPECGGEPGLQNTLGTFACHSALPRRHLI